jgi:hypothetical protein
MPWLTPWKRRSNVLMHAGREYNLLPSAAKYMRESVDPECHHHCSSSIAARSARPMATVLVSAAIVGREFYLHVWLHSLDILSFAVGFRAVAKLWIHWL